MSKIKPLDQSDPFESVSLGSRPNEGSVSSVSFSDSQPEQNKAEDQDTNRE